MTDAMSNSPKKPPAKQPSGFLAKNGADIMAGPKAATQPTKTPIIFIPQQRLNVGMDRWP